MRDVQRHRRLPGVLIEKDVKLDQDSLQQARPISNCQVRLPLEVGDAALPGIDQLLQLVPR